MERKRRLHIDIKRLQQLKTWQLLIILVLLGFVTATFLRLNSVGMAERRAAVLNADKAGDTTEIARRIVDLQRFAATHMNADTGRIELTEQYKRDTASLVAGASGGSGSNAYALADAVCKPQFPPSTYPAGYQQCMLTESAKHPIDPKILGNTKLPDAALYRYEFVSPLWTPDWAGWSALLCLGIIVVIIGRLITLGVLYLLLKRKYRDA